ncbi:hypothetical protein HK096_006991, partial [Nowakowskiella sp. JEL0078]
RNNSFLPKDHQQIANRVLQDLQKDLSDLDEDMFKSKRKSKPRKSQRDAKKKKDKAAAKSVLRPPRRSDPNAEAGTVVGGNAEKIGETNKGHRMLMAMGWSPGKGIGVGNDGIEGEARNTEPIEVVIRIPRAGLGVD